jgi:hypothetical protein
LFFLSLEARNEYSHFVEKEENQEGRKEGRKGGRKERREGGRKERIKKERKKGKSSKT